VASAAFRGQEDTHALADAAIECFFL